MKAILTYHSLDPSGSAISLDPWAFEQHIRWLATSGPAVVPLRELAAASPEVDALSITFDDALASFAETALPLLVDNGLPATLFVVTGRVGSTNEWAGHPEPGIPTLRLMTWDELGRARDAGIELGAHTRTHPRLTETSDAALADETAGSFQDLRRCLDVEARTFCYPYGAVDERVAAAAARVCAVACTTRLGVLGEDDPVRLPRLDMVYFRDPRRLEAWGTPGFLRYVRLRAAARGVRSALRMVGAGGRP